MMASAAGCCMRLALPLFLLAALLLPTASADRQLCLPETDVCLTDQSSSTAGCPSDSESETTVFADSLNLYVWGISDRHEGCGSDSHTSMVIVRSSGSEVEWYGTTSNDPNDPGHCAIIVREDPRHGHFVPCPAALGPPDPGWGHLLP